MKKITSALLLLCSLLSLAACGDSNNGVNNKDNLQVNYVLMARTLNVQADEVKVSTNDRTISMKFTHGGDFSRVTVKLTLAKGVEMVEPATEEAVYDLTRPASVTLRYKGETIVYTFDVSIEYEAVDPASLGWTKTTEFGTLPGYITVYKAPATLQGKNAVAYIAVADLGAGAKWQVLGEKTGLKTPSQFYDANAKPAIVMNAGYFASTATVSLICRDGAIVAPNIQSITRSNGSENVAFHPTRSAFAEMADGRLEADWVYTVAGQLTYAYPAPAPNKAGATPAQTPSATYPEGAVEWKPKTAIGGGPVLLKNGMVKNTWEAELIDAASGIGPTSNNPRSAIGATGDGKLVFFVCEGRNMTPGVPGYTLAEEAAILKDLGCIEALNLDGGGSSCMLINGNPTILPSDGHQRSVATAVTLN